MKENKDTLSLEGISGMLREGYLSLLANASKVIAVITLTVAALVTFTDVSFSHFGGAEFTSSLAVMLIASYLIYFSLEDAGERLGCESEEYKRALESYRTARGAIAPTAIGALRDYCRRYSAEEADFRRKSYISERGYTPEEYGAYRGGATVKGRAKRVFRHAERIRAVRLTPSVLLTLERTGRRSELESPERKKLLDMLLRLLPSTLCTVFTVSVMLTAKEGLTAETVIEGILKLSTLPIIGFKGYSAGYSYAKDTKSAWLETKARLLEGFIAEA